MKRNVKTLIIGATYFGIGYASAHPDDCLILEDSQILGSEFHDGSLTADTTEIGEKEAACELGQLMKTHHVWEHGMFDTLKAAPVIHKYLTLRKDIRILLDAKLLSAQKCEDGYRVSYVTNNGINEVFCEQLLDTTPLRDTYPEGARCLKKTLNAFTLCMTDTFREKLLNVCPDCIITDNLFPKEKTVTFSFPADETLLEAYKKVTEIWQKAFPDAEEKILFLAQDFGYLCEPVNESAAPCPWNSTRFPNPLTAFISGMDFQL